FVGHRHHQGEDVEGHALLADHEAAGESGDPELLLFLERVPLLLVLGPVDVARVPDVLDGLFPQAPREDVLAEALGGLAVGLAADEALDLLESLLRQRNTPSSPRTWPKLYPR